MNTKLYEKVKKVIANEMGLDERKITPKSDFINDLGCDSLDTVELVMKAEETFGIVISDTDAEKVKTVEEFVNLIEEKTNGWWESN